jgi:hypothetical protein
VTCPYCALVAPRGALHRHLVEAHGEAIATERHDDEGRMFYAVRCPRCQGEIRHQVKPRWTDPGFLHEFGREIRMVAFDLLLLHLEDAHSDDGQ